MLDKKRKFLFFGIIDAIFPYNNELVILFCDEVFFFCGSLCILFFYVAFPFLCAVIVLLGFG